MFLRNLFVVRSAAEGGGDGGGEGPKALTEEDVGKVLGPMVNGAVMNHLKKALPAALAEALGGLNLDGKIGEAIAKLAPPPPQDEPKGKAPKDDVLQRQIADLASKLEASERARADAERARADADAQRRHDAAVTEFRNAIAPKLRPELLGVAVSHWATVEGRLKVGDDGVATLRVKRAPYKGAPEEEADLPLAEAIPALLSSEAAKPFLPAPSTPAPKTQTRAPFAGAPSPAGQPVGLDDAAKAAAVIEALARSGVDPSDAFA